MTEADIKRVREMIDSAIQLAVDYPTRKKGDTPTDGYQLTPQKYVNANGSVLGRPVTSVAQIGQFYLSTSTGAFTPMWFTPNKNWVNGVGSVVA